MLKIAVCDDSREDVKVLEDAFDKIHHDAVDYDVFYSTKDLIKYCKINNEVYHMYILDIEMPENGLELAKKLRSADSNALFVFLTNHSNYVMDVFEVFTFDFIIKPITAEKLESVITNAMNYIGMMKQEFIFKFRNNQFSVKYDDILYIAKKGRQAMICTPSDSYKTNMTTEELWQQLDHRVFSHIHISYIINLKHIRKIEGNEVELDDGEHFIISRSHKRELKEKHMKFVNRIM